MIQVTIYGIVKLDNWRDNRGYSLVDFTYLYDGSIPFKYSDILTKHGGGTYYIAGTNMQMIPLRGPHGELVADKVTISDVTIGTQEVQPQSNVESDYETVQNLTISNPFPYI